MSFEDLILRAQARNQRKVDTKPPDALDVLAAKAKRKMHPDRREIERILALPYSLNLTEAEAEAVSHQRLLAEPYAKGFRLFAEQASAVLAYDRVGGGFFPIGVGWGKTGICVMIAEAAWKKGQRKILMLLEPGCISQLTQTDIPFWRRHVPVSVPFINLGGLTPAQRKRRYESGRAGCYIVPYSLLGPRGLKMLDGIDPELVIADECHNLKDRRTGRTKAWEHVMKSGNREFVAMSGTITGTASLTGVDDLTLEGTFATKFDSSGNLTLAGAVDIDVLGMATLSGEFAVEKPALATANATLEDATLVNGATGTVTETQQGGVKQSSAFDLTVAEMRDGALSVHRHGPALKGGPVGLLLHQLSGWGL